MTFVTRFKQSKHLFYECENTKLILQFIWDIIKEEIDINFASIVNCDVHKKVTHIANFLILLAKQYIFGNKCQAITLTVKGFETIMKQRYQLEKYNALKENNIKGFYNKWDAIRILNM